MLEVFSGMPIFKSPYAYEETNEPIRVHRRKTRSCYHRRIQKKWNKRFGFSCVRKPCAFMFGGRLIVHPELYPELIRQLKERSIEGTRHWG